MCCFNVCSLKKYGASKYSEYNLGVQPLLLLCGPFFIWMCTVYFFNLVRSEAMKFSFNLQAKTICPVGNRKKRAVDETGSDLYLEGERVRVRRNASNPQTSIVLGQRTTLDT
jgi:hypothetical protein